MFMVLLRLELPLMMLILYGSSLPNHSQSRQLEVVRLSSMDVTAVDGAKRLKEISTKLV
jgi:hypothetical protein